MPQDTENSNGGPKNSRHNAAFAAILLAFIIYGLHQIYGLSVLFGGERHFLLADDQMISMTYAKNLIAGNGFVWFKGAPRVEGVTNPLWVLIMAAVQLLPLGATKISLAVQLLCLTLLCANLFLVRRLSQHLLGKESPWILAAVALVAFYYPLNFWSLSGFEVALLAPLTTFALLWQLEDANEGRQNPGPLYLTAAATLIRLDMVAVFGALAAHRLLFQGKSGLKPLLHGTAALTAIIAAQTLARYAYFGEILPNTYYLKMEGYPAALRMARGSKVFLDFLARSWFVAALVPLALLNPARLRPLSLPVGTFAAMALYSVYVGGDSWEFYGICNRFVVLAMPAAIVVLVVLAFDLQNKYLGKISGRGASEKAVALAASLLLLIALNNTGRENGYREIIFGGSAEQNNIRNQLAAARIAEIVTLPNASIGVVWAGIVPFLLERRFIDILGKNDRYVAHLPMHRFDPNEKTRLLNNNRDQSEAGFFYPGHLKWDYDYSIGQSRPDVITSLWQLDQSAKELIEKNYVNLTAMGASILLRKGSPNLNQEGINLLTGMK